MGRLNSCKHCGLNTDQEQEFCCQGCEMAYKIINKLGLSNYYQMRLLNGSEKKLKPEMEDIIDIDEFVISENDIHHLCLAISGLHCAACIWLIENILNKQPNVIKARVNLSKKRLYLEWQGDKKYGNQLVKSIFEIGYKLYPLDEEIMTKEDQKYNDDLLKALGVAGFGVGNIMLFSVSLWFSNHQNIGNNTRDLLHFASAIIALPVIIYSGRPFFSSALKAIKAKTTNMDFSISVAIILSAIVSLFESFRSRWDIYFDSAVMLIFFLLIGRYLDYKVRRKAFSIATDFALLAGSFAKIEFDSKVKIIPLKEVKKDMIMLIGAGEKIVADGVIIQGESEIDTSIITGESQPRLTTLKDEVYAGMINLSSPIKVRVTNIGQESLLGKIIELTDNFERSKNIYVRLADRLAKFYTPIVHLLALITFILWDFYFKQGWENSLLNATAVLIITCPCALALAVPIVQTITNYKLMKKAILVKSGQALEKLNDIDIIIFDKTGTLTKGEPKLIDIFLIKNQQKIALDIEQKNHYLQIAASLAKNSRHPIAGAIYNSFDGTLLDLEIKEQAGFGLESNYQTKEIKIGRKEFCDKEINIDQSLYANYLSCFMKFGEETLLLLFADELKEDAKSIITELQNSKKEIILLSGDNKYNVENVAAKLGIKNFYFEQTPLQKSQFILKKKSEGKILMVGDGLNDAPAIALADISISFSKASHITKNAAEIIIQGQKLSPIIEVINTAKKTLKLMKQNLLIALAYNLIAVPFAIAGHVTPLVAAIAMSSSSLIVLLNSLRAGKK
jgi:Cu2+-exporting ATPase